MDKLVNGTIQKKEKIIDIYTPNNVPLYKTSTTVYKTLEKHKQNYSGRSKYLVITNISTRQNSTRKY